MEEECRTCMLAAQAGDANAYRRLLNNLAPYVRALHAAHCSPSDADDLTQETLLAIHLKRATYDPTQPLLPWVAAIARYKRIDFFRFRGRLRETELPDDAELSAAVPSPTTQEDREVVLRLLAMLPDDQAKVVRAVKLDGLTIHEVALKLNRSIAWVKINVHRGIKFLAQRMEEKVL